MTTVNKNDQRTLLLIIGVALIILLSACRLLSPGSKADEDGSARNDTNTVTNNEPGSSIPGGQAECLPGIVVGKTTQTEVVSLLGEPESTLDQSDGSVMLYPSAIKGQFVSILIQNQIVTYVSVPIGEDDSIKWSIIMEQFGQPDFTAYSQYQQSAMTNVFTQQGLAFIVDESMDVVFVKECFVPMNLEDYLKTWGASLPSEDPYNK